MGKRHVLYAIVLLLALGSCNREAQQETGSGKQQFVRFTSVVEGTYTRAAGASWTPSDAIGVYMKKNGSELSAGSIVGEGDNVEYFTENGDGNFLPVSTYLSFPDDGTKVDFIGYYPYQETINNFIYPVDVTEQKNQEDIDLLYADNLVGREQASVVGNLQFRHILSRIVLTLQVTDGTSLDGLVVSILNVKTSAKFNLVDGTLTTEEQSAGNVNMRVRKTNTGAIAEAILIPQSLDTGMKISLTLGEKKSTVTLDNVKSIIGGNSYTTTCNVKGGGTVTDPEATKYAKWRETPVITKEQLANNRLIYATFYMPDENKMYEPDSNNSIILRNYSMLYDKDLKFAYWVAYPLFPKCTGNSGRTDAWNYAPSTIIPYADQANLSSGFGSGYDRGHQIPSGDRTCNKPTNETTFYYANMTPQTGTKMNQSIWRLLEDKVRGWRSGTDTVFVVTGAMPPQNNIKYLKGMAIPEYYFKALARKINNKFHTIAFKLNNEDFSYTDYMKNAISVSELEKLTGFTFFPSIDVETKQALELNLWQ
ncbi:fimbrillin family protein [Bacteroides faecium]|uniref:DNA/RNA non-specific endonuclease n=1 Tax=Bacteroides faecium TaxID=2715212 RepID=A0A6H0KKB7_9BACE|nr:fimbrillin family protein [Bacteroides faecium]QIU93894.1 hypothetical protein BacF7301_06930 [Bacteroides faecium]